MTGGVLRIILANAFLLISNVLINFLMPRYLNVESYSILRTFSLYTTYIGITHLGYVDGVYIKYGGCSLDRIDKQKLNEDLSTLRIFQFAALVLVSVIAVILKDRVLFVFAIVSLPRNMTSFFKMLFQATGTFEKYSKLLNFSTLLTFVVNIVLLMVIRTDEANLYLTGYIAIDVFIWALMEKYAKKFLGKTKLFFFNWKVWISNVSQGIFIMAGNLSSFILVGMDRWCVKFLMDTQSFAEYSFAASIENMINLFTTPLSLTLYSYLCIDRTKKEIQVVKNFLLLWGGFILALFYPIKGFVLDFIPGYKLALKVIIFLIPAQYIGLLVKGIYINLYKAKAKQTTYFKKLNIILVLAFLLNMLLFGIIKRMEAFAVATLISTIFWLILSILDFDYIKFEKKEIVFLIATNMMFIIYGLHLTWLWGAIMYLITYLILSVILIRKGLGDVLAICKNVIRNKLFK